METEDALDVGRGHGLFGLPAGIKKHSSQAIAAATINAAYAIRREDRVGSLEVGKQADMLLLSVPDYRQLGYRFGTNLVKKVIKRGRAYSVDVGYYQTA